MQHIRYYFSKNIIEYIKVFIVFTIGVVVSVIVINNSNNFQKQELNSYVDGKISSVKNSEYSNSNANEVFIDSVKENTKVLVFLGFLSSTIIGIPFAYYIVAKKGFSIGYTISAIYATQNTRRAMIFICNSLLIHNIIYMVSMFIVIVSGNNLAKIMIANEKKNIKFEIIRYIIFLLLAFVIVIISSLFEAYISTNFLYFLKKYL